MAWLKGTGVGRFLRAYYLLNGLAVGTYAYARTTALFGADGRTKDFLFEWVSAACLLRLSQITDRHTFFLILC